MSSFLNDLVASLNTVLFDFGSDAVTWAELLGFATGAICVWLTVRVQVWNFPIGIANNVFFFVLFWSAKLYADAGLQVVYLALAALGWWEWLHGGEKRGERPMSRATPRNLIVLAALVIPATWGLSVLLTHANDIAPFWDALTTALSLAAQWLLNFKRFENWFFWIAADVIYIPLYFVKNLYLTGIVYIVFLGLCLIGLHAWWSQLAAARQVREQAAPVGPSSTPTATVTA